MVAEGLVLLFTARSQAPKTVTDRCPTFNQFQFLKGFSAEEELWKRKLGPLEAG